MLKIENLHASIGDKEILKGINLTVGKGEIHAIMGPNGSGKSTLLKTISAEVPLTQGSAHVLGFDLTHIKSKDLPKLRRRLGIVFQNFQLLPDLTVQDNLDIVLRAFGVSRSSERSSRIEEALRDVGLETKSYKYPHELSGGEQQRVAIARALIGQPELILADEPTGNLDAENGLAIAELLHRLTKERGTAVIMATHNRLVLERYPARCVEMAEV